MKFNVKAIDKRKFIISVVDAGRIIFSQTKFVKINDNVYYVADIVHVGGQWYELSLISENQTETEFELLERD